MVSHQPFLPVTGWTLATCWSPVSAWQISTALLRVGVERAVGLVGDLERRQFDAGIELERLVGAKAREQESRGLSASRARRVAAVRRPLQLGLGRSSPSTPALRPDYRRADGLGVGAGRF